MQTKILEAAWLLPITSPPIKNGGVLIAGSKIEGIAKKQDLSRLLVGKDFTRRNYGPAIILPGFINLHAHLEYTDLQTLSAAGGLFSWLPRLMAATSNWSELDRIQSIRKGIKEIMAAGTTFVVDNSYSGASIKELARSGLRGLVGLELFGVDQSTSDKQWQRWQERLQELLSDPAVKQSQKEQRIDITVAPHAPYTVCPTLWRHAEQWAKLNNQTVLTHLAESEAESDWFSGSETVLTQFLVGAFGRLDPQFADLYQEIMIWKEGNLTPVEHLYRHNLLGENLLAAHVVNVSDEDIKLLKDNNVAVAHCPRSNTRLGCGRAPLGKFFKNGLRVGLGTDSKASNDDLDLLAESRFATEWHKKHGDELQLESQDIVELLTIKAAACLNREDELGSLAQGKLADIAVFALSDDQRFHQTEADPYDLLFNGSAKLQALFVNGTEIKFDA